jgi:hypothetical protein
MDIRDYDPTTGQAFQGDVSIIPVPPGISISTVDEIKPVAGRLILQEGEVSGHHHAINLRERSFQAQPRETGDPVMVTRDPKLSKAFGGASKKTAAVVRMYRNPTAVDAMVSAGILTRTDLAIGFLVIPPGVEVVGHEEHDGIRLLGGDGGTIKPNLEIWPGGYAFQAGRSFIGGQVESAGSDERRVID